MVSEHLFYVRLIGDSGCLSHSEFVCYFVCVCGHVCAHVCMHVYMHMCTQMHIYFYIRGGQRTTLSIIHSSPSFLVPLS